jgi:hypothetical protein
MRSGDKVLVQARVPKWVRDSLQHEAAKEQRSVSNLLAKWLAESCEPVQKLPVAAAPPGPPSFIPPTTTEGRPRHVLRDPADMPPEDPR